VSVTALNQNAEYQRLIDWTNAAWMDIQSTREDWQWMRTEFSFPTVLNKATYTPSEIGIGSNFGNWYRYNFRSYPTLVGNQAEIPVGYVDYEDWRNTYQFGATRYSPSQPIDASIAPNKALALGPVPLAGYTVTGDYFRSPSEMLADNDEPSIPSSFHLIIVYRAMMFYGGSEAATEVYQRGELEFNRVMTRLQLNQMPQIYLARPLA
jgi:hypothetical protein